MRTYTLAHHPSGQVVRHLHAAKSDRLYDVVDRSPLPLKTRCKGSSMCGQCWVRVVDGFEQLPPPEPDEQALLDRNAPGVENARLACKLVLPPGVERLTVATDYWSPGDA